MTSPKSYFIILLAVALVESAKLYSLNRDTNKDIRPEDKFNKIQQKVSVNVRNAEQVKNIHRDKKRRSSSDVKEEIRRNELNPQDDSSGDDSSRSHHRGRITNDEVRKKVATIKDDRKNKVNVKDDSSGDKNRRWGNRHIESASSQVDGDFSGRSESDPSVRHSSSSDEDTPVRLPDRIRGTKRKYGGGHKHHRSSSVRNNRHHRSSSGDAKGCVTYCVKKHKRSHRDCLINCRDHSDNEDSEDSDRDSSGIDKRTAKRVIAASDIKTKRTPARITARGNDDSGDYEDSEDNDNDENSGINKRTPKRVLVGKQTVFKTIPVQNREDSEATEEQIDGYSNDIDDKIKIKRVAKGVVKSADPKRAEKVAVAKVVAKVVKDTAVRPPSFKRGVDTKPPVDNDSATEETDVKRTPPVGTSAAFGDSVLKDPLGIKKTLSANGYKEITKQRINQNFDVKVHENHGLMAFSMPNEG